MGKSRKYIFDAINKCLEKHGDWITISDLHPLVCGKLRMYISIPRLNSHMILLDKAERRKEGYVYEYRRRR